MRQTKLDEFLDLTLENEELTKKFNNELKKNKEKDKILFQQSKLASLGEMLGNISHQWRQPLMEMSSLFMPVEAKLNAGIKVEEEELVETIEKLHNITKYMSDTIEDFRNFFSIDKEKTPFKPLDQINSTINIISGTLKSAEIKLDVYIHKNPELQGFKNEYSQVLINLITNSKDILIQRKIKNPRIIIKVLEEDGKIITTVEDNGGGIEVKPIDKIFEPFFTSKKKNGTGIGLFMSKIIIENNMNGSLTASNIKDGACFKIIIPKN